MGWHFIYHDRHFFYMTGRNDGVIRFCVPHLVKVNEYNTALLPEAINENKQEREIHQGCHLVRESKTSQNLRQIVPTLSSLNKTIRQRICIQQFIQKHEEYINGFSNHHVRTMFLSWKQW